MSAGEEPAGAGRVAELWRYPVKSMRGERLDALPVDSRGGLGDRLFAVRDEAGKLGSGKTTRRFRFMEGLFRFEARLEGTTAQVRLRLSSRTERCVMVTFEQSELAADPRVLRALAPDFRFGIYAEVIVPGTIRVGDAVGGA